MPAWNAVSREILAGELEVGLSSAGARIIECDGLAVARCLREPDIAGNHGLEEKPLEILAEGLGNLLGKVCAIVVHGEEDPLDANLGVECGLDALKGGDELGDAFKREVLGLHRNKQSVGGDQDIECKQIEGGWTVENNEIVVGLDGLECAAEAGFAGISGSQLDICTCKVFGAGQKPETVELGRQDGLIRWGIADQDLIYRVSIVVSLKAEAGGCVGLWVAVNQQDLEALDCQAGREIDGGGGFANAALLIDHAQNLAHGLSG
jgi:hypothetical protein